MGKRTPFQWNCEGCPASGLLQPPTEPIMEDGKEIDVPVTDENGQPVIEMVKDPKTKKEVPKVKMTKKNVQKNKLVKVKQQDPVTGQIRVVEVPAHKDLAPRIYRVSITLGNEQINRFFCKDCLKKRHDKLKAAWDAIEETDEA